MFATTVTWFHRLSSPLWFVRITRIWPWWIGCTGITLAIVTALWGIAFAPPDYVQGNSYRIIYIHVPSAFLAQSAYLVMGIASLVYFVWKIHLADYAARVIAPVGALFTFLALFTGSIWGLPTWGTWWFWDARITTMFILLLLYIGIMLLRHSIHNAKASANATAILTILGTVNIPIIKYSVDWWFTLHQPASLSFTKAPTMPASMWIPLLTMILAFYCIFMWLTIIRIRTLIFSIRTFK